MNERREKEVGRVWRSIKTNCHLLLLMLDDGALFKTEGEMNFRKFFRRLMEVGR